MWRVSDNRTWGTLAVVLVCLFTVLETVWLSQHHSYWTMQIKAAQGVASGTPHWRVYQCRILGPMLVRGGAAVTGLSFEQCYAPVFFLLLLGANLAYCVFFLRVCANKKEAVACWLASVGIFLAVQDIHWLYLWDIVDLSVMLGLVAVIHFRAGTWSQVLLCAVAVLNRDSWRYIPAWMLLSLPTLLAQRQRREAIQRSLAALGCLLIGQLWVSFITAQLFRAETMGDSTIRIADLFLQVPWNLRTLRDGDGWMFGVIVAALTALLWRARRNLEERFVPLCLLMLLYLGSTFCFARITETRVFIQYIPFLIWLGCLAAKQKSLNAPAQ